LFEAYRLPPGQGVQWPSFMHILLKRLYDSGYIESHEPTFRVTVGNLRATTDIVAITSKGRAFVEEFGLHEL